MKIVVPGIPCGNLASVVRMIQRCGGNASIVTMPAEVASSDKIILAGVGAFDYGMRNLLEAGWVDALNEAVLEQHKPVLGICLGMQLMCTSSEEGNLAGLGWVDAQVRRFDPLAASNLKVPHMGWSTIKVTKPGPLLDGGATEHRFYFVHSYHVTCERRQDVLATAHHGIDFDAAFSKDNVYGVQFHPEKSHRFGVCLLRRFVELSC